MGMISRVSARSSRKIKSLAFEILLLSDWRAGMRSGRSQDTKQNRDLRDSRLDGGGLGAYGFFDDAAVEEMKGAVRNAGVARVVRDHANCRAVLVQFAEKIHHRGAILGIQESKNGRSVDLPHPEGPAIETNSPLPMLRWISSHRSHGESIGKDEARFTCRKFASYAEALVGRTRRRGLVPGFGNCMCQKFVSG